VRLAALALAAFLYAAFSSPTPDTPGWIEFSILTLLPVALSGFKMPRDRWVWPLAALLAYGITVPLAIAALSGHAAGDIVRDLVAFGALAFPLLLACLFPAGDKRAQNILLAILLGIGMIFSLRYLLNAWQNLGGLGLNALDHNFLYLANSPLVAFTAAFLLLRGCFSEKRPHVALALVMLSFIPLAAMIGMMQRATLGLLACVWLALFIHALIKNPPRAGVIVLVCTLIMSALWPLPLLTWGALADKTLQVGWNARGLELAALLDALNQNPLTAIFGTGWGSLVKSPSVGDQWVRFSHSLMTSLLWKTGWLGLIAGAIAIGALIMAAMQRLRRDMVLASALILPLLPALFLYGSYKSLCFGLLLLGLVRLDWTSPRTK